MRRHGLYSLGIRTPGETGDVRPEFPEWRSTTPSHMEGSVVRPTPADSLSVSLKRAANTFSLLSVSVSVSSNTPHPTPHAVYDTWGPPAGARARRELRRGERKCGNGERRDTTSILRRGMWSLLERAIVPQTVQNADAEWDRECCWSWSKGRGVLTRGPQASVMRSRVCEGSCPAGPASQGVMARAIWRP
jgi:hypothetical protein